jgi:hypothetical protein
MDTLGAQSMSVLLLQRPCYLCTHAYCKQRPEFRCDSNTTGVCQLVLEAICRNCVCLCETGVIEGSACFERGNCVCSHTILKLNGIATDVTMND